MAVERSRPAATASATRGPYAKTAARRLDIIDAAVATFGRSGYASASIREIADRIGMSHATLIFHFKSKDELLAAVLERSEESYKPVLEIAADAPVAFLAYVLEFFENKLPGESEMLLRLATEARDPAHPAHPYMLRRYRRLLNDFTGVFQALAGRRLLKRSVDAAQAARLTVALMDGLQISAQYQAVPAAVSDDLGAFFDSVLNAAGRREVAALRAREHVDLPPREV